MKVSVVGVGYVGLVAAACLAEGGNHVTCVDKDEDKMDDLVHGKIPIYEPGLAELVKRNVEAGRLVFTTDLSEAVLNSLIIVLGVGTPSAPDGSADISAVSPLMPSFTGLGHALVRAGGFHYTYRRAGHAKALMVG